MFVAAFTTKTQDVLRDKKFKSSSDMDYLRRIADDELSLRLEAFGAVQINGPKWCGIWSIKHSQSVRNNLNVVRRNSI